MSCYCTLFLSFIGSVYLVKLTISLMSGFSKYILPIFVQQVDLKKYGQWAVVTGSTDGIGKAFAFELAKQGLDIVLISRSQQKLEDTAKTIENEYKVNTLCIQVDFGTRGWYDNVKNQLNELNIGILVNNVGMAVSKLEKFYRFDEDFLLRQMDVNMTSTVLMSRLTLPGMVQRNSGLIMNISSVLSEWPMSYFGVYSATKAFINLFTASLKLEVEKHNIRVQCFTTGFVKTKLTENSLLENDEKMNYIAATPTQYAQSALLTLNSSSWLSSGFWKHGLTNSLLSFLGLEGREKLSRNVHSKPPKKERQE